MHEDRKRILNMLAAGKITVDEAERLINALQSNAQPVESAKSNEDHSKRKSRFLRVEVNEKDGDQVNIRVPLALLSSGVKLAKFIPGLAGKQVDDALNSINGGDHNGLASALGDLEVNVDNDKETVRIFCE